MMSDLGNTPGVLGLRNTFLTPPCACTRLYAIVPVMAYRLICSAVPCGVIVHVSAGKVLLRVKSGDSHDLKIWTVIIVFSESL